MISAPAPVQATFDKGTYAQAWRLLAVLPSETVHQCPEPMVHCFGVQHAWPAVSSSAQQALQEAALCSARVGTPETMTSGGLAWSDGRQCSKLDPWAIKCLHSIGRAGVVDQGACCVEPDTWRQQRAVDVTGDGLQCNSKQAWCPVVTTDWCPELEKLQSHPLCSAASQQGTQTQHRLFGTLLP